MYSIWFSEHNIQKHKELREKNELLCCSLYCGVGSFFRIQYGRVFRADDNDLFGHNAAQSNIKMGIMKLG